MESYDSVQQLLGFDLPLPVNEQWSAAADFLQIITGHCLANEPEIIVECGSGLTTLVLAGCCRLTGRGHVYSLENGDEYATKTRRDLDAFALGEFATVIHAPLENWSISGEDYLWYGLDDLHVQAIDMLVIDGPPGALQKNARYPALPLLYRRLADNAAVYLDDAGRDDEKAVVGLWQRDFPSMSHEYIETKRGCSALSVIEPQR